MNTPYPKPDTLAPHPYPAPAFLSPPPYPAPDALPVPGTDALPANTYPPDWRRMPYPATRRRMPYPPTPTHRATRRPPPGRIKSDSASAGPLPTDPDHDAAGDQDGYKPRKRREGSQDSYSHLAAPE